MLEGKNECVSTTPKILQSPGTLFRTLRVKRRNMNRTKAVWKGWRVCSCCPYSDTSTYFAAQMFSKPLSAALSIFHPCILAKDAGLFFFPKSKLALRSLMKFLRCVQAFPWPLQRTKDLIFNWNDLAHTAFLSIRGTEPFVPIIWWGSHKMSFFFC